MGIKCSSVLILINRQCFNFLNDIVPTFFKFELACSMLQVSTSYSRKHKTRYEKQKQNQKLTVFGRKNT